MTKINIYIKKLSVTLLAITVLLTGLLMSATPAFAAPGINYQIGYQGFLKDSSGNIVPDGDYDMVFNIYDVSTGGIPLWTGTHTGANSNPIVVDNGFFHALLGSGTGNAMTVDFTQDEYYIGITVGADSEMSPRHRIAAHPQAFNADLLDGLDSTAFVQSLGSPTGSSVNGGNISSGVLSLSLADDTNPGLVSTGTQTFAGDKTFNGALTFNSSTVTIPNNLNFDSNTLFIDANNNRVGIGTVTPGANKLFVAASNLEGIRVASALDENLGIGLIRGTGDGASTTTYNGALESWFGIAFRSKVDGIVRQTFNTRTGDAYLAGNVGIGTTSPADKLQVAGDVRVGTGITGCVKDTDGSVIAGTCSSDVRLKTGVVDMDSILNKFTGLRFVNYHWNDTAVNEYRYGAQAVQRGLIADEVEALFPELVHIDDKGYKTLDYSTLSLYGLKAIQELSEKVDMLMTAVNGYFKRIFANELCLTDSSGQLVCVTGENLRQIGGQVPIQNNEEATQSDDQTITTAKTEGVQEITTPIPAEEIAKDEITTQSAIEQEFNEQ